ncbi:hypothetical protein FKW77_008686 [Venturia effusa]|uniref:Uncharacterized protein n=1 Tax=Venturia effusa TaxID=50376 RepID=A0A517L9U1_9PEZI|nr:hypothetical protein FKW77_008686 [Venturia effusa]
MADRDADLAEYSKEVGKSLSQLGLDQAVLSLQISAETYLRNAESVRWTDDFPENGRESYKMLCQKVLHIDDYVEQQFQDLKVYLVFTQERARTLMTVLFNLIARQDVNASIELAKDSRTIALAAKNDSSSMKTIAVMTMLFLPGTFFAALFSTPMLDWNASGSQVIQPRFGYYWAFTIPCTIAVFICWYFITKRQKATEAKEDLEERAKVVQRTNTFSSMADAEHPVKPTLKQKAQVLAKRLPRWRQDVKPPAI